MNNMAYLAVGFGITWAAFVWYAWRVSRRIRAATADLAGRGGDAERDRAS